MNIIDSGFFYWIIFAIPSIVIASTFHEYAHAWTATKLGDLTSKVNGRLTLNPLKHIDPLGALCMILFKFGWSKPVPINEYNFENRTRDTALVSIAGPLSNFFLLLVISALNSLLRPTGGLAVFFVTFAMVNIVLAIFNLLPIPPLDGHKIVRAFLPQKARYYWENLERFQIPFLIILLIPIFPFGSIISLLISKVSSLLLSVLGLI
ncbi:site-2 protease family protein [Candidatus Dojkabacteria bacterium]|uniref:Site-2 protease family protein n=1 Tax=Candidatus Dojkabacteria bacterium TaxID=2099670 RepID=A0A847CY35_9BACT|nr:site-2 protease family protein [Candidatus Dojkabacteria bacterium]